MTEPELAREFLQQIPRCMWAIRHEMRKNAPMDLSVAQYRVLAQLSFKTLTNKELAELIGVSVPAMSRLVDHLARKGLIDREVNPKDRRQARLKLTASGAEVFEQVREGAQSEFTKKFQELEAKDRRLLTDSFKIIERLFAP